MLKSIWKNFIETFFALLHLYVGVTTFPNYQQRFSQTKTNTQHQHIHKHKCLRATLLKNTSNITKNIIVVPMSIDPAPY